MRHFKFFTLLLLLLLGIACTTDDDYGLVETNEKITTLDLAAKSSNNNDKELVVEVFENEDFTGRSEKVYLPTTYIGIGKLILKFTAKSWAIKKGTRIYTNGVNNLSQSLNITVAHPINDDLYSSILYSQFARIPPGIYSIHTPKPGEVIPQSSTSFQSIGNSVAVTRTYAGHVRSKALFSDSPVASIPIWNSIDFNNQPSTILQVKFLPGIYDFKPVPTSSNKKHHKWHHAQFISKENGTNHIIHGAPITHHELLGSNPDIHPVVRKKIDGVVLTSMEEVGIGIAEAGVEEPAFAIAIFKKIYDVLPILGQKLDAQAANIDNDFLRGLDCFYSISLKATHPENAANITESFHQCVTRNSAGNIRTYSGGSLNQLSSSQKTNIYNQTNSAGKKMEDRLKTAKEKMEEVLDRAVSFNRLSVRFFGTNNEKFVMWYSYTETNGLKLAGAYPDPLGTQRNQNDAFESMVTNNVIDMDYDEVIILNDKTDGGKSGSTPDALANCDRMIEFKNYVESSPVEGGKRAINQFASLYTAVKSLQKRGKITIGTRRDKLSLEKPITKNALQKRLNSIPTTGKQKCLPIGFQVTFRFVKPNTQLNSNAPVQDITEYTLTKTQ